MPQFTPSVCRQAFAAILAALTILAFSSCEEDPPKREISSSSTPVSEIEPSSDNSVFSEPSSKADTDFSTASTPPKKPSDTTFVPENPPQTTDAYLPYVYSEPVPKNDAVDNSYFDDAVFIGDSRTQGFILYNGLSNATAYMSKGLKVDTAFTKEDIEVNGTKVSVMDALAQNASFQKVYVMLGVNELGWAYSDIFIEKYGQLVDKIKEINPDAEIYIQSILPVSEKKSTGDEIYNMQKINEYNALIQKMAGEKTVYYLNVAEAVANGSGYLPEEASTDGVHLNKEYCAIWLDYLKTHTVKNISH